ncbi:MAG: hypothetical protein H6667_19065 [Ardenticatenaceae bacterium]|nr:hypothetical protein [Ardenticatenaceae bacterium]
MFGKFLRIVGIVLLGLTAVITLLSGVGTTCVALDAAQFGMDSLASYQWLYIFYVAAGIVIGALGIWATVGLIKSQNGAYRLSLIALILGLLTGGLHMATSRALRGSSMPTDFIVYATILTLVVFLLFRTPGIWNRLNLTSQDDDVTGIGAGVALIVGGTAVLTAHYWASLDHMIAGINQADVWHRQFMIIGWLAVVPGVVLLATNVLEISLRSTLHRAFHPKSSL